MSSQDQTTTDLHGEPREAIELGYPARRAPTIVTPARLAGAASLCAVLAGLLFIGVQVNHPHLDLTAVTTSEFKVRQTVKVLMAALSLIGITGMYLAQVNRIGVLGLIGYVLFGVGYLVMLAVEFVGPVVLIRTALSVMGITYLGGGFIFGIALFRAGILARSASALLAVGTVGTTALAALPESFNRPLAIPVGVAFIGLGISLWRDHHDAPIVTVCIRPVREHAVR